ncbi:hypothetical protein FQA39_LY15682 [Lamprigera yunnana]|nr:hypothetical protein FQA39_LY15682 [Lamprigera yunnana]
MENIFCLKPIIDYRLEVVQSRKLKEFYHNLVKCVIVPKSKRGEIQRMAAAAVGDVNVALDENERLNNNMVSENDKLNYLKMLDATNVLRRSYNPDKQKHGVKSRKYIHTIKPLLLWERERRRRERQQQDQIEHTNSNSITSGGQLYKQFIPGGGGVGHEGAPIEYRYWNNVHELMDEFQVLWAQKEAGHSGHNIGILAILEELYEDGYIKSLPKTV